MGSVGGRSAWVSWVVGFLIVGILVVLAWLAIPGLPALGEWLVGFLSGGMFGPAEPAPS